MELAIRRYADGDIEAMRGIWNAVVEEGVAFPQERALSRDEAATFFAEQSLSAVAERDGEVLGLYILHPNNVGRCGHIANASYAVRPGLRGGGIGRRLVEHSLEAAAALDFRLIQFNAVVASNTGAIRLYESLGFRRLGAVPGGFRLDGGVYADILLFYRELAGEARDV